MRYQVLVAKDPKGNDFHEIFNFATEEEAQKKAKELVLAGYRGVFVWDIYNNPLSDLLRF